MGQRRRRTGRRPGHMSMGAPSARWAGPAAWRGREATAATGPGLLRHLLGALAALLALAWVFAPGAVAGGPTSVLIVSPESQQATALYSTMPAYQELAKHLAELDSPAIVTEGREDRPVSVDSSVESREITVTWMAHDVQPWRVDRLYPSGNATEFWINTSADAPATRSGLWHKAAQPKELHALLARLELMGPKVPDRVGGLNFPPSWATTGDADAPAEAVPATAQPAARSAPDGDSDPAGWWWALPALGAGLVLGLVLRPLAARLPRPPFGRGGRTEEGPRQQLLDV